MTLLDTLKSLLGMESTESRSDDGDVGVTVEREGDQEPEPVSSPASGDDEEEEVEEEEAEEEAAEEEAEAEDEEAAEEEAEAEDEEAAEDEAEAEDEEGAGGEPTDTLEGIGPTYAERLADAGVETVAELAEADAAELAPDVENVGESKMETWIERAQDH